MKTSPTPTPSPTPADNITQRQYDEYAANWVAASSDPAGTVLAQSFRLGKNKPLLASLRFPARQIARLVSTVGAVHIKARFLIKVDAKTKEPHFTAALFATDALGTRLSSYYLADEYWLTKSSPKPVLKKTAAAARIQPTAVRTFTRTDVPDVLSQLWMAAWAAITVATPPLFATTYGPLRGYTYEVNEFIIPLRPVSFKYLDDESLLLEFGLHEYYRSEPQGEALVQTFGLLLKLESNKMQVGDDPSVNMGSPCPPVC